VALTIAVIARDRVIAVIGKPVVRCWLRGFGQREAAKKTIGIPLPLCGIGINSIKSQAGKKLLIAGVHADGHL